MTRNLFILAMLVFSLFACSEEKPTPTPNDKVKPGLGFKAKVIYGRDNRADLYELGNSPWRQTAHATVALIRQDKLAYRSGNEYEVRTTNFGQSYNLCPTEPYRDQGTAAFCSGFFIGADKIVTAGHCIRSQSDCESTSAVFGFAINTEGQQPTRVSGANVYRCRSVLKTQVSASDGVDFAIITLERNVTGVTPVTLRSSGVARVGDELVVIGHPVGLPTKVAPEGIVRTINPGFLVASLDTYGGNSGSAVFNADSGEVEGILVRGEMDFKSVGACRVSYTCAQGECRGEDVTRIDHVLKALSENP